MKRKAAYQGLVLTLFNLIKIDEFCLIIIGIIYLLLPLPATISTGYELQQIKQKRNCILNMMEGTNKYSLIKLNDGNYYTWKFKMRMILIKEDLWEITTNTPPPTTDAAWIKKDGGAQAAIALSVEDAQIGLIRECTSAYEMWEAIKRMFEHSSLSSKTHLRKCFYRITMRKEMGMRDYLNAIEELASRLRNLGENIPEEQIVAVILGGLPDQYEGLITALEARDESDLTLNFIKTKLMDEAIRKENKESEMKRSPGLQTDYRVNYAKIDRKCYNCGKPGHISRFCKENNQERTQSRYNTQVRQTNEPRREYEEFKPSTSYYTNSEPEATKRYNTYPKETSDNESDQVYFAFSESTYADGGKKEEWILDSGASVHMCMNKNILKEFETFESPKKVILANGEEVEAIGSGMCKLKPESNDKNLHSVRLLNVIFVPKLQVNLISVGKLCEQGYIVDFVDKYCHVYYNDIMVAIGNRMNKVYKMLLNNEEEERGLTACLHQWHRRLGHRNMQTIKDMGNEKSKLDIKIDTCTHSDYCETCKIGGMTQDPFNKPSQYMAKRPFELLYADVCGPISPKSLGGGIYFITINDSYSKFTYVKILKLKSDVTQIIIDFMNFNYNVFGYFPVYLRTDGGGGEFENEALNTYLTSKGIFHQLSLAYCPQQNGTAERKNRTLIEMTRKMLKDKDLPNQLWGEAVNTAAYLYNRTIHSKTKLTPYEMWYDKIPNLANLRVFGSTVFSLIHPKLRNKLDDTAMQGIMVGYGERQVGYRIWVPSQNKIVVSRSVSFKNEYNSQKGEIKCLMQMNNSNEIDLYFPQEFNDKAQNDCDPNLIPRKSIRENFGIPAKRFMYD